MNASYFPSATKGVASHWSMAWNEENNLNGHNPQQEESVCVMMEGAIPKRPIKVVHIITGLNTGGAEVMLRELLRFAAPGFEHEVISLSTIGPVGRSIQKMGVRVTALEMNSGLLAFLDIARLRRELKRARPDVVQTWLYHADIVGGIAARLAGVRELVWGLHMSHLDPATTKKSTLLMMRLGALLSHILPQVIVCCAKSTKHLHIRKGYAAQKMRVIFNGFDTHQFKPDPDACTWIRHELAIPATAFIVGMIGRFHPQKDHSNFVMAAQMAIQSQPDTFFLLCGEGCDESNPVLEQLIGNTELKQHFRLLGRRDDMAQVMAGLDVLVLSSAYGEAFPMVVGEAMSCGVLPVVTDVGDSSFLVGNCGRVVPPENAESLARAWRELLYMSPMRRTHLGQRGRERIKENFSIELVSAEYHALYRELVQSHANRTNKARASKKA